MAADSLMPVPGSPPPSSQQDGSRTSSEGQARRRRGPRKGCRIAAYVRGPHRVRAQAAVRTSVPPVTTGCLGARPQLLMEATEDRWSPSPGHT